MKKQLDLGAGGANRIEEGYGGYGVDIHAAERPWLKENKTCDLALEPIPYADDIFDLITAYDVLEHIPKVVYVPDHARLFKGTPFESDLTAELKKRNCLIELLNEVYRVLKDGGEFFFVVPKGGTEAYMSDPTHVSEWVEDSINHFSGDYYGQHDSYGHTSKFQKVSVQTDPEHDWRLQVRLRAVKPCQPPYEVSA